ncbi:Hypothetical protein I5071_52680 [Sandaracinus amylolyticus]|nr:Hypothetical protein I5071_52680 [Sandaracinus amylolyticus]
MLVSEHDGAQHAELEQKIARLELRAARLQAVVRLLVVLVRSMGLRLDGVRVPDGGTNARILAAVDRATPTLGRATALRVIGLDADRARVWRRRALACALDDAPPCPRAQPSRMTRDELAEMRDLVESERYLHLSTRTLALLAKRLGRVFASYATWKGFRSGRRCTAEALPTWSVNRQRRSRRGFSARRLANSASRVFQYGS